MTYPDMMKMRENYCENAVNILVIIGLFYLITILILVLGVGKLSARKHSAFTEDDSFVEADIIPLIVTVSVTYFKVNGKRNF